MIHRDVVPGCAALVLGLALVVIVGQYPITETSSAFALTIKGAAPLPLLIAANAWAALGWWRRGYGELLAAAAGISQIGAAAMAFGAPWLRLEATTLFAIGNAWLMACWLLPAKRSHDNKVNAGNL